MLTGKVVSGGQGEEALRDAFWVREEVFVREQGYELAIERDEKDAEAAHVIVYEDRDAVATGRLYLDEEAAWRLGRVAVLREKRGQGIGDLVMRMLLQLALQFGADVVYLGSQAHATGFYEKLGFRVCGEQYLDEGQPHFPMKAEQEDIQALFAGCEGCRQACPAKEM